MKSITIKDVAKALNISTSTVSRAFNNKYDIQPETRERILAKAREMGYSPNPIAQGLTMHKSFKIGVIVPEFINNYFPCVLMGIQKEMNEAGYQVLIMSSNESAVKELEECQDSGKEQNRRSADIIDARDKRHHLFSASDRQQYTYRAIQSGKPKTHHAKNHL